METLTLSRFCNFYDMLILKNIVQTNLKKKNFKLSSSFVTICQKEIFFVKVAELSQKNFIKRILHIFRH